jgi:hypothetical protein
MCLCASFVHLTLQKKKNPKDDYQITIKTLNPPTMLHKMYE